jgi:hypothetical protein
VTAGTLRKKIVGLKFARAGSAPKAGGHIFDLERRALRQSSGCQGIEGELKCLWDNAAQGPNPQADGIYAIGAGPPGLIQR